ncbi:POTRA domain-containing protein, partial [Escherichia coli]
MSKYPLICFLCLTAAVSVVYAGNLRLNIEGPEGQLNQNVRVQLSNISQDEVVPNGRFRAGVEKAIKEGLKPLGYYQPTVEFSSEEKTPPARSVLTAKVT